MEVTSVGLGILILEDLYGRRSSSVGVGEDFGTTRNFSTLAAEESEGECLSEAFGEWNVNKSCGA